MQRKFVVAMLYGSLACASAIFAFAPSALTSTGWLFAKDPERQPMGFTVFCTKYPAECARQGTSRLLPLTEARRRELAEVNTRVNAAIASAPNTGALDKWEIFPQNGDCDDYAVTKRHELMARGWPSSALLLSEAILPDGRHHLLLVARTADGDYVLDNLKPEIRELARVKGDYVWLRMQSAREPKFWSKVAS